MGKKGKKKGKEPVEEVVTPVAVTEERLRHQV